MDNYRYFYAVIIFMLFKLGKKGSRNDPVGLVSKREISTSTSLEFFFFFFFSYRAADVPMSKTGKEFRFKFEIQRFKPNIFIVESMSLP